MAVLHIIWWSVILVATICFMFLIKPLADYFFPVPEYEEDPVKPTWLCREEER